MFIRLPVCWAVSTMDTFVASELNFRAELERVASFSFDWLTDPDAYDSVVFLYSVTAYVAVRLFLGWVFPGLFDKGATNLARTFSTQQYIVLFIQKGLVLPCCGIAWLYGSCLPELIYILTGAYVLSDSMVNRRPVRGGSWGGNYAVHAHHLFTLILCLLGSNLPQHLIDEGALCILVGEAGSLWLTVAILYPSVTNVQIRFLTFVASRLAILFIALDVTRRLESPFNRGLMGSILGGLIFDNYRTLKSMGGMQAGLRGRSDSLAQLNGKAK